jgi:hypothetical protein
MVLQLLLKVLALHRQHRTVAQYRTRPKIQDKGENVALALTRR